MRRRARIVETAGKIILQDIRSTIFNTTSYPPIDNFHTGTYPLCRLEDAAFPVAHDHFDEQTGFIVAMEEKVSCAGTCHNNSRSTKIILVICYDWGCNILLQKSLDPSFF